MINLIYLLLRGVWRRHEVVLVVERQVHPETRVPTRRVDLVPPRHSRHRRPAAAGRADVLARARRPGAIGQGLVTVHRGGVAAGGHRRH